MARVLDQELATVAVGDLEFHPRNPRRGSVGAIEASLERNGFYGAAVVQRSTGFVLVGNHQIGRAHV